MPTARLVAVVAGGGAAGALARFSVESLLPWQSTGWPWAIFVVNILGCAGIGLAAGLLADAQARGAYVPEWWRPLVITGFLGGFTTFSSYILEVVILIESGSPSSLIVALTYLFGSVVFGVLMVWLTLHLTARVPWRTWSTDVDIG